MTIFLAAGTGVACTFYLYVLVQFLRDDARMLRQIRKRLNRPARLSDCTSH
jgi:hypothetical protein